MKKIMVLVLAVCVAALTAFALQAAPAAPGPTVAAVPSSGPTPSALWIGDSFTEGYSPDPQVEGYACEISSAMGWTCNVDAQGGTGYVNNGRANVKTYVPLKDRLPRTYRTYLADVIVVDAGRNDGQKPVATVAAAARKYLTNLRKRWPKAEIVVVAPYYLDTTRDPASFWRHLAHELESIAAEIDASFIDPVASGWIPPPDVKKLTSADGIHPNAAGYQYITKHLAKELRRLGLDDAKVTDQRGPAFN